MDVAVMVKRGPPSPPGEPPVMAVSSADALHHVVGHFEVPPETPAGPWAVVIVASVVSMSARVEHVALNLVAPLNAVSTIAALEIVVLKTAVWMSAAQTIADLLIGARVAVVSRTVQSAAIAPDVRTDLIIVLMNNPVVRPVLMAPRVSRMICSGGVTPPRRHWRPVGPFTASGAPLRCGAHPNSWRCCAMRKRLACWWKKSPGHVWLR